MSKKVKLPKEQAEAIEKLRNYGVSDFGIIANMVKDLEPPSELNDYLETLRKYSHGNEGGKADDLLDALRIGYEIIPQYKVGDWVVNIHSGEIGQIEEIKRVNTSGDNNRIIVNSVINYPDSLRHATPEEEAKEKKRQFWHKLGREEDEYKQGDFVKWNGKYGVVGHPVKDSELVDVHVLAWGSAHLVNKKKLTLVIQTEKRLDKKMKGE